MVMLCRRQTRAHLIKNSSQVAVLVAAIASVLFASSEASDIERTNCTPVDMAFSEAKQVFTPWLEYMTETIKSHQSSELTTIWQKPLHARVIDAVNSRPDVERAIFWFGIDKNGCVQDLTLSLGTGRPMVDQLLRNAITNSSPFKPPPGEALFPANYRVVTAFQNDGKAITVSSELRKEVPSQKLQSNKSLVNPITWDAESKQ